jgi:hypothetical protein
MAGIESPTTGNGVEINAATRAMRVSDYPNDVTGWFSIGAQSGAVTGAAAGSELFSLRNASAKLLIVRRVGVGLIATTGFTAAQKVDLGLIIARNFTAASTGGTAIALTGSNGKHRTSLATPLSLDMRIATTGNMAGSVRTLDANTVSQTGGFAAAAGTGVLITPALNNLFGHDTGDYPLVLAQNEGIILQNLTLLGAGGIVSLTVNIELAEADSF